MGDAEQRWREGLRAAVGRAGGPSAVGEAGFDVQLRRWMKENGPFPTLRTMISLAELLAPDFSLAEQVRLYGVDAAQGDLLPASQDQAGGEGVRLTFGRPPGYVFISYVREDSLDVDRLQQIIEATGAQVWRDTAHLWPGEDWRAKIRQAITKDVLVFLACFSRNSLARRVTYQNEELTLAVDQMRLRRPGEPWLIPVRFDDSDIPDFDIGGGRTLTSLQRADLFGDGYDLNVTKLTKAVWRILGHETGST
jgi:hypothetical protein